MAHVDAMRCLLLAFVTVVGATCSGGDRSVAPARVSSGEAANSGSPPYVTPSVLPSSGSSISTSFPPAPNGQEWPASFRPYGATSPWNSPVPPNPRLHPNSAAIIAAYQTNTPNIATWACCTGHDYSHPIYFASTSDPLVTAHCTQYCTGPDWTMYIPAKARPATGYDHHMAVVQPDGTEDDFWNARYPDEDFRTGSTLDAGITTHCGNFYTGPGVGFGGQTAGQACLAGGLIRQAELAAGRINHALFAVVDCVSSATVPPAQAPATACSDQTNALPTGARIWLDTDDAAIQAMAITSWEKAIMMAWHDYGGYVMDTSGGRAPGGGLITNMMEEDEQFVAMGTNPTPPQTWAASVGWSPTTISPCCGFTQSAVQYIGNPTWGGFDWAGHLHVIAYP